MSNKFTVTSLDLSGISDEDLKDSRPSSNQNFIKFLKDEGTHTFTIIEATRMEDRKDAAGKLWGSVKIMASADGAGASTGMIKTFLDVPVESALYTAQNGNASKVKTQIFVRALESITGQKVLTADIPSHVSNLDNLLAPGAVFKASVKYKNDHITRNGDTFNITMVDGTLMVDENGAPLSFSDYAGATAYYQQVKNRKPATGLEIVSYLSTTPLAVAKVA